MLTTFPQYKFTLKFPETFSQNHIYVSIDLSVSGISKIMHYGILTNMPYLNFSKNFFPVGRLTDK